MKSQEELTEMEEMKRAEEVMIPLDKYPHVPYWYSLREVIAVMERATFEVNNRQSIPRVVLIFDEQYRLLGLARRRDVLRGLEPTFLESKSLQYRKKLFDVAVDPNLSELRWDHVVKGIREQKTRPVSDVMRPIEAILDASDHVIKAVYEMVTLDVSPIPGLKDGRVVGVVRTVDVFQELARLLR